MPRFYFHLFNHETIVDNEGTELPDRDSAMARAAYMAREMAAESVREGSLDVHHRIEVTDEDNDRIGTVEFGQVVELKM